MVLLSSSSDAEKGNCVDGEISSRIVFIKSCVLFIGVDWCLHRGSMKGLGLWSFGVVIYLFF